MTTERIQLDPSMGGRSVAYVNVPEARHYEYITIDRDWCEVEWTHVGMGTAKEALSQLAERRKKHHPIIDGMTITYEDDGIKYRITYEEVTE